MGVDDSDPVDLSNHAAMRQMIKSIITVECGRLSYSDALIDDALKLAGVDVPADPPKPLTQSRTMQGLAVTAVGVLGMLLDNQDTLITLAGLISPGFAQALPPLLALAGMLRAAHARWDDQRTGVK
jgi:hypothetical protein